MAHDYILHKGIAHSISLEEAIKRKLSPNGHPVICEVKKFKSPRTSSPGYLEMLDYEIETEEDEHEFKGRVFVLGDFYAPRSETPKNRIVTHLDCKYGVPMHKHRSGRKFYVPIQFYKSK